MSLILTNREVSGRIFKGKPVPHPNTVTAEENAQIQEEIIELILSVIRKEILPDDRWNDFKLVAAILYKQRIRGEDMEIPDKWKTTLKRRYRSVPLVVHDPTQYDTGVY